MKSPLIWAGGAHGIEGRVCALSDTHAGSAKEQEDVSAQAVATQELLFEELMPPCGEWPWQGMGRTRNVFAP
jgi:hypothetical protein